MIRSRTRSRGGFVPTTLVELPSAFLARWTPSFNIYERGRTYSTDFNFDALKMTGGSTVYVSKTGNDTTGTGTSGNPYRTLAKAYSVSAQTVMVGSGLWDRTDGFAANFNPTYSMNIISSDGSGKAILSRNVTGLSWVQQASPNDHVYLATRSSVRTVLDFTATGRSGEYLKDGVTPTPIPLSVQTSIANCEANPGSWYLSGSNLYVRTWDGRAPDSNIAVLLIENIFTVTNSVNIWMDGIEMFGDSGPRHAPSADNTNYWAWRNSSARFCGSTSNLLTVNNSDYCYSISCDLTDHIGSSDGLNYHADQVGLTTRTKALEVNCFVRRAGNNDGSRNDNASTAHDNCSVIRLNGDYQQTYGPTIADVLGAHSLNFGCKSGNTFLTDNSGQDSAFQIGTVSTIDGTNSKMWVKNCTSVGSNYALYQVAGGDMYDWGGNVDQTTLHNNGTITTYP